MFVGAVLAPHRAEHRPFKVVRLTADELAHASSLEGSETDLGSGVLLRLRRRRPRDRRGRTHASLPGPTKRSTWSAKERRSARRVCTWLYTSSMSVCSRSYARRLRRFARCSNRYASDLSMTPCPATA